MSGQASTIVVKEIPERVECQPEFEEMDLDVQYDPKKEFEGANFGGVKFNLPSARKAKIVDDVHTLKLDNTVKTF